jgi:predicted nucleic acid-binding protein
MIATSLIDTNVLVYRFDARFPEKQAIATRLSTSMNTAMRVSERR